MDMPAARHEKQTVLTKLSRGKANRNFWKTRDCQTTKPKEGEQFGDSVYSNKNLMAKNGKNGPNPPRHSGEKGFTSNKIRQRFSPSSVSPTFCWFTLQDLESVSVQFVGERDLCTLRECLKIPQLKFHHCHPLIIGNTLPITERNDIRGNATQILVVTSYKNHEIC